MMMMMMMTTCDDQIWSSSHHLSGDFIVFFFFSFSENRKFCETRWVVTGSIRVPAVLKQRWPPNNVFTVVLSVLLLCLEALFFLGGRVGSHLWVFLQFGILLPSARKDDLTWVKPSARTHVRIERGPIRRRSNAVPRPVNFADDGRGETLALFTTKGAESSA